MIVFFSSDNPAESYVSKVSVMLSYHYIRKQKAQRDRIKTIIKQRKGK